jgi:beta-1,2-mannobiose phosphorylase / 1,2-beta-oligomannan phosphorylase
MTKRWLVRFAMAAFACAVLAGRGREARADDFPRALVAWSPIAGNPVFEGAGDQAWDRKIRERGYILVEEGTYHLWYTGYNDDRSPTRFLGHATSPDGLRWTRDPANPVFTGSWTEDVCVLKRDGRYLMFAEGKNDVAHQLVSTDRVHWSDLGALDVRKVDGAPIPPGPYGTPSVWFEEGTWYLFYERGDQGVWLATSMDRQVWTNVRDTPVLALGPEPYDRAAVAFNQVIKRDRVYYAFYHANAQRPWKDWTTNIARSRDLVHWEKYPGNPIIKDNCSSAILVAGPDGDRLYTMHPDVKVFRPAATIPPR